MTKPPPRITSSYLENAALHYLERFAASSASLRRVLLRKVDRSLAHWGGGREEYLAEIEAVIAKLARLGYVDDAVYAGQKARALHRRGKPARTIRAALAAKGVGAELVEQAIDGLAEDAADPDLAAAIRLAKKRRLGPFRASGRAETRAKDLAALVRAGFDLDTARRVIEAESPEGLDTP